MRTGRRSVVRIAACRGSSFPCPTPIGQGKLEEDDPLTELTHLLDQARSAGVDPDDLDLVDLLLRNPSVEQVAVQLEVTARTVRNRRARVAAKLRDVALAA